MQYLVFKSVLLLASVFLFTKSEPCHLADVKKRAGDCVHIRECKYQVGRLRVGANVTRCDATGHVCCPRSHSVAEEKCSEWRELLHHPAAFSQPRLSYPKCAYDTFPTVDGSDASNFEFQHVVALGYGADPENITFHCAATLISEMYLLTAAQCVKNAKIITNSSLYVMLSDTNLYPNKNRPSPYRNTIKISHQFVHPDYRDIYHDIAILRLSTPMEPSRYLLPSCLGTAVTPYFWSEKGIQIETAGWGMESNQSNKVLKPSIMTTLDRNSCHSLFKLEPDSDQTISQGILRSQMCATAEDSKLSSGDLGGGVFISQSKCLFHVIGVMSYAATATATALFTKVAAYQDWIENIVWSNEAIVDHHQPRHC